jgi:hypothetical protein
MFRRLIIVGTAAVAALVVGASPHAGRAGAATTPTLYRSTALRLIPTVAEAESDQITTKGAISPATLGAPGLTSAAIAEYTSADAAIGSTSIATFVFRTEAAGQTRYDSLCKGCAPQKFNGWRFKPNQGTGALVAQCRNVVVQAVRQGTTVNVFPKLKVLVDGIFAQAAALGMTPCSVSSVAKPQPAKPTAPKQPAKPVAPKPSVPHPRFAGVSVKTWRASGAQNLVFKFKGPTRLLPFCQQIKPVKVKVILKTKGIRYVLSRSWCDDGEPGIGKLGRNGLAEWKESGGFFWNISTQEPATEIEPDSKSVFIASHLANGYHGTLSFGYWVTIGGKLARSGRVQVSVNSYLRTIHDDEDDFVNVCINDLEKIYSSGGRLYCFTQEFNYSMKLLR